MLRVHLQDLLILRRRPPGIARPLLGHRQVEAMREVLRLQLHRRPQRPHRLLVQPLLAVRHAQVGFGLGVTVVCHHRPGQQIDRPVEPTL